MEPFIRFRCPGCRARIKAAPELRGQTRCCPGCGVPVVVRPPAPEDAGPVLLFEGLAALRTVRSA